MQVPLRPAWLALAEHARSIKHRHLRDLFAFDYEDFTLEGYQAHPHIKAEVSV